MDLIDHWSENGFARKERHGSEILIRILLKERTLKLSLTLSSVPLSSINNLSFPDAFDIVIYCFVFLFVSLVVVLCCLRCCYCLVFFVCLFCFVFVFNSKTILKFHSLFYVSWNDSRDRIVVSTLRCGRNNPGSNPGHGTHKTVSFFSISFFFLSFYFYPSKCSMLFLIFFLIVSSFSFGDFEECRYFVSKWYKIQWLLKITTACRVSDLTMSI